MAGKTGGFGKKLPSLKGVFCLKFSRQAAKKQEFKGKEGKLASGLANRETEVFEETDF